MDKLKGFNQPSKYEKRKISQKERLNLKEGIMVASLALTSVMMSLGILIPREVEAGSSATITYSEGGGAEDTVDVFGAEARKYQLSEGVVSSLQNQLRLHLKDHPEREDWEWAINSELFNSGILKVEIIGYDEDNNPYFILDSYFLDGDKELMMEGDEAERFAPPVTEEGTGDTIEDPERRRYAKEIKRFLEESEIIFDSDFFSEQAIQAYAEDKEGVGSYYLDRISTFINFYKKGFLQGANFNPSDIKIEKDEKVVFGGATIFFKVGDLGFIFPDAPEDEEAFILTDREVVKKVEFILDGDKVKVLEKFSSAIEPEFFPVEELSYTKLLSYYSGH